MTLGFATLCRAMSPLAPVAMRKCRRFMLAPAYMLQAESRHARLGGGSVCVRSVRSVPGVRGFLSGRDWIGGVGEILFFVVFVFVIFFIFFCFDVSE